MLSALKQPIIVDILTIAQNPLPVGTTLKIYEKAGQYLGEWFAAPDQMNELANHWVNDIGNKAGDAADACYGQFDKLQDYWTGPAAADFASYAGHMSDALSGLPTMANEAGKGLATLADDVRNLRDDIIHGCGQIATDLGNAAVQIYNAAFQDINIDNLIKAVVPPLAAWSYCVEVAAKISDELAGLLKELGDVATNVDKQVGVIKKDAVYAQAAVHEAMKRIPPLPFDVGDVKYWQPA